MSKRAVLRGKLLLRQQGLCFFCYVQMVAAEADNDPRACRIFSLDDRYAPWKGRFAGHLRHVAACHECVSEISDKRQQNVPIEELHRRSGGRNHGEETVYFIKQATP